MLGLLINCSIATYLTGSALIPLGLTWWQATICERDAPIRFDMKYTKYIYISHCRG